MDFSHLFAQSSPIPTHAIAAMLALILGTWQLLTKKKNTTHRYIGYTWILLMLYVSISGFWIHSIQVIGLFSPIHLLSILTIWALYQSVKAAKQKNIVKHKKMMKLLYFFGLLVAGLFTLLPNRAMHEVLLI